MSWLTLNISSPPTSRKKPSISDLRVCIQSIITMASLKLAMLLGSLAIFLVLNGAASYPAIGIKWSTWLFYFHINTKYLPLADIIEAYDGIGVCIRNCAQCKKMLGSYFEGQACADSCVKFRGTVIPDCEDINSIAPFLNRELTQGLRTTRSGYRLSAPQF